MWQCTLRNPQQMETGPEREIKKKLLAMKLWYNNFHSGTKYGIMSFSSSYLNESFPHGEVSVIEEPGVKGHMKQLIIRS